MIKVGTLPKTLETLGYSAATEYLSEVNQSAGGKTSAATEGSAQGPAHLLSAEAAVDAAQNTQQKIQLAERAELKRLYNEILALRGPFTKETLKPFFVALINSPCLGREEDMGSWHSPLLQLMSHFPHNNQTERVNNFKFIADLCKDCKLPPQQILKLCQHWIQSDLKVFTPGDGYRILAYYYQSLPANYQRLGDDMLREYLSNSAKRELILRDNLVQNEKTHTPNLQRVPLHYSDWFGFSADCFDTREQERMPKIMEDVLYDHLCDLRSKHPNGRFLVDFRSSLNPKFHANCPENFFSPLVQRLADARFYCELGGNTHIKLGTAVAGLEQLQKDLQRTQLLEEGEGKR